MNPIAHSSILLLIPLWLHPIPPVLSLHAPVPSHFSHLIPLMEVFPLAQDQVVLPVRPRPHSGVAWPKELCSHHQSRGPLCSRGQTVWHRCFLLVHLCFLFKHSSSLPNLLRCFFTWLIYHVKCSWNPTLLLYFKRSWQSQVDCCFLVGRGFRRGLGEKCFCNVIPRVCTRLGSEICTTESSDHEVPAILSVDQLIINQPPPTFCCCHNRFVTSINCVASEQTKSTGFQR